MNISLTALDYFIIISYFFLVFFIAWKVTDKNQKHSDDYFLGGRNLGWFAIGASLFASNIGSEHLIGLAGAGAKGGVAVAQFEILAGIILLVLGWVFVPFYIRSGVTTMPEFLQIRYNKTARNYLSFISIIAYVMTKISVTIFAGAVVFEAIGFDFWTGAFAIVIATGIYTVMGGLKAVIYTDMLQMFIMIGGAVLVTIIGFSHIGGWSGMRATLDPEFFNMWKVASHPEFPWTGILFGAPILGVWYWCTDQFIVQRVLSAKNISNARKGTIFGGFLKQLPLFIFVIPGMIAFVMVQKGMITLASNDHALPTLIAAILPVGIKGLVVAGLLAALMSSLSSVFNSCSTLITFDIYKRMKPGSTEKKLIRVGQIATVVLVIAGLLWIPLMKYVQGSLFNYLQSVQAYISPPIASVFLLGLFIRRLNSAGALTALFGGFILGMARLILEMNRSSLDGFLLSYASINFLNFAVFLFVICSVLFIVVSLMTEKPDYEKIKLVTHDWSRKSVPLADSKMDRPDYETIPVVTHGWYKKIIVMTDAKKDFVLSLCLLVIIGIIWGYFS
ncbi:MAG: sodium/solute symporter [Desulfobacteraceae bacterium]|nr:sodium/solute symporter [Desulfobacteraceae bacterium]